MPGPARGPLRGLLALATVGALLGALPAQAEGDRSLPAASASPAASPDQGEVERSVTLVTGHVVRVTTPRQGPARVRVEPASGGAGGGYRVQQAGESTYVIPDAALPYLASGALDDDLFNVTRLVEQGYDDGAVETIPLIVQYRGNGAARSAPPARSTTTRSLPSIRGAAVRAEKQGAAEFWSSIAPADPAGGGQGSFARGIAAVHLDEKVRASLAQSVAQVGAPQAWEQGLDGTGVRVAVLDSGVDAQHPDLAGQIAQTRSFVPGEDVTDVSGHGTHVSSTIAGTGAASGGVEKGVAPGADLLVGKVLGDDGFGQASWIIAGMEWGAANADVVNMSLGSYEPSDGTDPMAQALDRISEETGTLFVVAAGNYGRVGGIGSPGAAAAALTVGAVDGQDRRAAFQDMGPVLGSGLVKPEIVAPGVDILAARSADSYGEGAYISMDGTSMATPHVAGAAAILLQRHPGWTGQQVKDALSSTAVPLAGESPYTVGDGRLDVPAALGALTATGTVSFGAYSWPHGDDAPAERTVTYRNSGGTPLTLDLTLETTDQDQAPAPAGLVELSGRSVTVPAGGLATVRLTAHPDLGAAATTYAGYLTASLDGDPVVRTGYGLVKEQELYSLDVSAVGRDGEPATEGYVTVYLHGDDRISAYALDPTSGTLPTLRLAPGDYDVSAWLPVSGQDGPDSLGVAWVGTPNLLLGADEHLVLDAREANPVTVRTPRPTEAARGVFGYYYGSFANQYVAEPNIDSVFAQPVPASRVDPSYHWVSWWHRTAPLLRLRAPGPGGGDLDEVYQQGSRRYSGKDRLPALAAGSGSAEDLAGLDVAGRAVVVVRDGSVDPWERAQTLEESGAALLVVVNDRPGRPYDPAGGTDLPVVGVSPGVGRPLLERLAAGPVTLHAEGTEFPDYTMDLTRDHLGELPAGLGYAPTLRELARVEQDFVGTDEETVFHDRAMCRDWQWPPCIEMYEPVRLGGSRTDYLTAEVPSRGEAGWFDQAIDLRGWLQRDTLRRYTPGEVAQRRWFEPVTRPVSGDGYWHSARTGELFTINVPMAGSGAAGITGNYEYGVTENVNRLYQDGVLLRQMDGFHSWQDVVPPTEGPTEYVFEQLNSHDPQLWGWSTRTETRWTFQARTDEPTVQHELPLMMLDYAVTTDARGRASARRPELTLTAWQFPGVQGAGDVVGASLQVSYDEGRTWQEADLRGGTDGARGSWTTQLVPPREAEHVSLRVTARDDAGNSVEQKVIRAFGTR